MGLERYRPPFRKSQVLDAHNLLLTTIMSTETRLQRFIPVFENGVAHTFDLGSFESARVISEVYMTITSMNLQFSRSDLLLADFSCLVRDFPHLKIIRFAIDQSCAMMFWDMGFPYFEPVVTVLTSLTLSQKDLERVDVMDHWSPLKEALMSMDCLQYLHLDAVVTCEEIDLFTPNTLPSLRVLIAPDRAVACTSTVCLGIGTDFSLALFTATPTRTTMRMIFVEVPPVIPPIPQRHVTWHTPCSYDNNLTMLGVICPDQQHFPHFDGLRSIVNMRTFFAMTPRKESEVDRLYKDLEKLVTKAFHLERMKVACVTLPEVNTLFEHRFMRPLYRLTEFIYQDRKGVHKKALVPIAKVYGMWFRSNCQTFT